MTRTEALERVAAAARDMLDYSTHEPHCRWQMGGKCDCANRDLQVALAALDAAADSEDGWLPIETAPRGEMILGISRAGTYRVGELYNSGRAWDAVIEPKTGRFLICKYWRPLPAPPSQEQKP